MGAASLRQPEILGAAAPTDVPQKAGAAAMLLGDGRLHLQHGPIDLVIGADGTPAAVNAAFLAAQHRFATILEELVDELPVLRAPMQAASPPPHGVVARRMWQAARCHTGRYKGKNYLTAMAAVAGAVADEVLAAMSDRAGCECAELDRAYVNNGGDIALYLKARSPFLQKFDIGICADPDIVFSRFSDAAARHHGQPQKSPARPFAGTITIYANDRVGGVATSGWKGRSHSLGVADFVTILAPDAAAADVAATLIANAVNVDNSAAIKRQPAHQLAPDSDLGRRLVTLSVAPLPVDDIMTALKAGARMAQKMIASGNIYAAYGVVQGYGFHCDVGNVMVGNMPNQGQV